MQHPRWREGRLSTGFIAEEFKGGFKPRAPKAEELQLLAAVAIAVDHLTNARRRQITGQMGGPSVRFASRRIAMVGTERVEALVEGMLGAPIKVTFDGKGKRRDTLELQSDWWPGQPVWTGMVHGKPVSVQVRPILNGYDLAHRGIRAKARVYTEQEAALAALMPEKAPPDTSKLLLCPMPGLVKAIHVARRAGHQGRRGAVRGRGHEDGEHPARRTRRRGQDRQGQARRQPRRRRRHHGIRVIGAMSFPRFDGGWRPGGHHQAMTMTMRST